MLAGLLAGGEIATLAEPQHHVEKAVLRLPVGDRKLLAADRAEVACYTLVALAALIRVFGGMLLPGEYAATVVVSGVCWSAAFALYAVRYWPVLTHDRLDGKPG